MANLESVIHRLQRALKNRVSQLAISVTSGGVDNMETYKYTIGQINALESVRQELSNLLEDKEQNDGTIVDIKRGKTDPLTK
jgi:predicted nuclease with RNAse H fold